MENSYLSGSNKAPDNEKPLIVKYNHLAKAPSLDMSAVLAARCYGPTREKIPLLRPSFYALVAVKARRMN